MAGLPSGTVTFLYTDIEGSTALWEQQPQAMRAAVARHDALLRDAIAAHDGHLFRTVGDGLCAAFATAPDALAAALAAQQALQVEDWHTLEPLRVRLALHTGAAESRAGDYVGSCLNRVGRLLAAGHGRQALLSQATADLARDTLPAGASLRDLGEHRLRDLVQPERIFQLLHPALPADFPPLRSLDAYPHNLPLQLTSFVGRAAEMAEVTRLLATTRLLTLTGTGGCGKTRLALQVAADQVDASPDGVWLVELAPLAEPDLVAQAVATVLGVREQPGQPILTTLVAWLKAKRLLLVLDNCEHLLDACAHLAESLLRACPSLVILATSRELLSTPGEVAWRVPSLTVPDPRQMTTAEAVRQGDAGQLFVERARQVVPAFVVSEHNAAAVLQICRRLDGIPLAIELAAARVRVLTAEQIAARLDDRFRLLTGGKRTGLRRQQTLQAAIDWSHDLLTADERVLLRRLAVFAGGWTLAAAESVGGAEPVDAEHVLDVLTSLVDKSLVLADAQGAEERYRLLETVRQYAEDKLLTSGEAVAVRERHAQHYLALAEWDRRPRRLTAVQIDQLDAEYDNLRAALRWMVEVGDAEAGLRLCGSLTSFWYIRGFPGEGRAWLAEVLALPAAAMPTPGRAGALVAAARLAWHQDDPAAARAACAEAVAILRARGDAGELAHALATLGRAMLAQGDYDAAQVVLEEALALGRASGDTGAIRHVLEVRFQLAYYQGDYALARALVEEQLALVQAAGHASGRRGPALNWLGHIAVAEGDYARARACYLESLAARQAFAFFGVGLAFTLSGCANLTAALGKHTRAARLAGAAARLCEADGVPPQRVQEAGIAARLDASRRAIGEAAFASAWAEGQALSRDEAVAYAQAEDGGEEAGG
jgi:predicted ATPase/class 3 adenylate cyclase